MKFNLESYLTDRQRIIEAELARVIGPGVPERLQAAMEYSLLAGGKRLRPILTLAACEALGKDPVANPLLALPAACALEMIHTYSLIHDDLPAMDDDDFRRGKPTNHRYFGEALAILAGDALLTDAFLVLTRTAAPASVIVALTRELSSAAGAAGMVGGQVIDVEATGKPMDLPLLTKLHRMKTGALLSCAVHCGALVGEATEDQFARLSTYGQALGLAFQMIDDVLDVTADLQTLGKDPGSDREAGKITFVELLGVDGTRSRAREVMAEGVAALSPFGTAAEPLRALSTYTLERDR